MFEGQGAKKRKRAPWRALYYLIFSTGWASKGHFITFSPLFQNPLANATATPDRRPSNSGGGEGEVNSCCCVFVVILKFWILLEVSTEVLDAGELSESKTCD